VAGSLVLQQPHFHPADLTVVLVNQITAGIADKMGLETDPLAHQIRVGRSDDQINTMERDGRSLRSIGEGIRLYPGPETYCRRAANAEAIASGRFHRGERYVALTSYRNRSLAAIRE
jgi:hypothetical protein